MTLADFHFLRPEWLLALIPAAVLTAQAARRMARTGRDEWAGLVDEHLLGHLAVRGKSAERSRWMAWALALALFAAVIAMAGPTWQKIAVPAFRSATPTVVVLSMAQSMNGTDVSPNRITRAGHKLRDLLDRAKGDDVALIIYSDRPFVAAPLTSDGDVIQQMLPELSTSLMPVLGNRLDLALSEAENLLSRASAHDGRIVVLADDAGQKPGASRDEAAAARRSGYTVSVIGIGTEGGAVLRTARGDAITTSEGADVTMRLDVEGLTKVASAGGGVYTRIAPDDRDIQAVLPQRNSDTRPSGGTSDLTADTWYDMGHLFLFLPILLAPLAFRRGLLFALALGLCGAGLAPSGAQAGVWADLWLTPDQQGQRSFDQGAFDAAADQFASRDWKAGALYRNGDFDAAAGLFSKNGYNRGNALAQAGQFEEALAAYDEWLGTVPQDADAQFNREIVQKLLDQQNQDQQQQQQSQDDQAGEDQQQSSQQDPSGQGDGENGPDQQDGGSENQQAGQPGAQGSDAQAGDGPQEDAQAKNQSDRQAGSSPPQAGDQAQGDGAKGQADASGAQNTPASAQQNPDGGNAPDSTDKDFANAMDQQLEGQGSPTDLDEAGSSAQSGTDAPVLDQVAEQQLRSVPDDPSGLLRARIRQHYNRLRAANQ